MNRQESLTDRMINDVAGLNPADLEIDLRNRSETKSLISESKLTSENISVRMRRGIAAAMAVVALAGPMASEAEAESLPPMMVDTAVETTPDIVTPEPTAEVKAAVTAAVEDPEAKVSVEDLKDIFESYRQRLFAPYKEELKDLGCEDEARIDFCSKVLYAYNNGKDMFNGNTEDKFQNYITRDQITEYAKTGEGLEVLTNENGEPRILMVNSTEKITQGVIDSIQSFKNNGCINIQEVLYDNGAVIYFCSDYNDGRGFGSFMITEYGVIHSQMTKENTDNLDPITLERTNTGSIYVESVGITQQQMRRSIEGMWEFGNTIGDVEVTKSLIVGYAYLSLYDMTGFIGFSVESKNLISIGINTFASQFDISPTDPRIEKQIAMLSVVSKPLTGVDWDNVPEIQRMRETYLAAN